MEIYSSNAVLFMRRVKRKGESRWKLQSEKENRIISWSWWNVQQLYELYIRNELTNDFFY